MLITYQQGHGELVRTLPASKDRQGKNKEMKQTASYAKWPLAGSVVSAPKHYLITCDPIEKDKNAWDIFGPGPRPRSGPLGPGNVYRIPPPRLVGTDYHQYPSAEIRNDWVCALTPTGTSEASSSTILASPYLCPIASSLTAKTQFVRLTRQLIRFFQPTSIIPS